MKTKILLISLVLLVMTIAAAGCSTEEQKLYGPVMTSVAQGTPLPPYYQTMAATYLPSLTPEGPKAIDLAATMIYQQMAQQLTQQVADQKRAEQQAAVSATAAAQATAAKRQAEREAAATQAARDLATQQAFVAFSTETQQAWSQYSTATQQERFIRGTATERSWLVAAAMTQTALPIHQTLEAGNMQARMTEQAAGAEGAALAVKRQQIKNTADAVLPWSITIAALMITGALVYFATRMRTFERDETGAASVIGVLKGGTTVLVDPDRMPIPAMRIDKNGGVTAPMLTAEKLQADTTRRAQAVQAMRAMPSSGQQRQSLNLMGAFQGPAGVEVLDSRSLGPVLDEVESKLVEEG